MTTMNIQRVNALPAILAASTLYIVKGVAGDLADLYFSGTNPAEVRRVLNKTDIMGFIEAATSANANQLATARVIAVTGDATWSVSFDGSTDVTGALTLADSGVTAGRHTAVTVDSKGRVVVGGALVAADIPELDASKITTGTLSRDTTGNAATATALQTARNINGVAFDGTADITINAVDSTPRIAVSEKGAANGVATLNASGIIPAEQLPSYVDDVVEYVNLAAFPVEGESSKIYIAQDTSSIYRWSGSQYIEISAQLSNSESATILATARSISATGDATWSVLFNGSSDVTADIILANTGVVAGTYPKVTVDAKGRVTGGAALAVADIPMLDCTTVTSAASVCLVVADW